MAWHAGALSGQAGAAKPSADGCELRRQVHLNRGGLGGEEQSAGLGHVGGVAALKEEGGEVRTPDAERSLVAESLVHG